MAASRARRIRACRILLGCLLATLALVSCGCGGPAYVLVVTDASPDQVCGDRLYRGVPTNTCFDVGRDFPDGDGHDLQVGDCVEISYGFESASIASVNRVSCD